VGIIIICNSNYVITRKMSQMKVLNEFYTRKKVGDGREHDFGLSLSAHTKICIQPLTFIKLLTISKNYNCTN